MSRDTTYYDGGTHIFQSDNTDTIRLKAGSGQTLVVEGTLSSTTSTKNKQVIYNKSGVLSGLDDFTYNDSTKALSLGTAGSLYTNSISGLTDTNSLGYNEIYQGTAPQSLATAFTTPFRAIGTDVSVSDNNYIALSAPFYSAGASQGGVSVWSKPSSTFVEYGSALSYTNFTLDAEVKFCAINETGDLLTLGAGDAMGYCSTYTRSGSVWTAQSLVYEIRAMKLSGTRMLAYNYNSKFSTYLFNGTSWALEQDIFDPGAIPSYSIDYPMILKGSTLAIYYSGQIKIYTKGTTWTLSKSINTSSFTCYDLSGTVFTIVANGNLYVYENFNLITAFTDLTYTYCCTNGTYVFGNTSGGVLSVIKKVAGVWTKSTNTYSTMYGRKMACNANYLVVGGPGDTTYGRGYVFPIAAYDNSPQAINTISPAYLSQKIKLDSTFGTIINGPTTDISVGGVNRLSVSNTSIVPTVGITYYPIPSLLFNGAFQVLQRPGTITVSPSTSPYTIDRWQLFVGINNTCVVSRQTHPVSLGGKIARVARNSGSTGVDPIIFGQTLTQEMTAPAIGNYVTFSFYARCGATWSPSAGALSVIVNSGTNANFSGINGFLSGNTNVISQTATITTTWTKFVYTSASVIPGTVTQLCARFSWTPVGTAGATDYIEFGDVQLDPAPFPMVFRQLSYSEELARCMTFYQILNVASGYGVTITSIQLGVPLYQMRALPSIISSVNMVGGGTGSSIVITDGVANYTQSSFAITSLLQRAQGGIVGLSNFTGITIGKPYLLNDNAGPNSGLTFNAELF